MTEIQYKQPLDDFQRLLFAENHIKELRRLAGQDQALIEELQDRIRELEQPQKLTPEEKVQLKEKNKEIDLLRKKNRELINEIINLKLHGKTL